MENIKETQQEEEVSTQEPHQQQKFIAVTKLRQEIRKLARFVDTMAYAIPIIDDDVLFVC